MRILAFFFLILSLPLIIFITLVIFIESKSSVIFQQKRVGQYQQIFTIYKFKTMENNQITVVGKVIRKLGLDEIPQLLNIMKGEMAFVGPRPLTQFDIDRLQWNDEKFAKRWRVKPGITGLAQLSNVCNAELSIQNDLNYVENKSFLLDLKIFFQSLIVPVMGKFTQ